MPCLFESGLTKLTLDRDKKMQVLIWSSCCKLLWNALDPVVVTYFVCKKYLCRENHKYRNSQIWNCDFPYMNIFCKKRLGQVHLQKNDWIRPLLVFFFLSFFEKNYNNWIKSRLKWTVLISFSNCCWKFQSDLKDRLCIKFFLP